jgi:drug/metabolite transporter (DMT)-like permease
LRSHPALVGEHLLLLILATLWGASFTFIRVAVLTIPPLTLIAARTLVAGSMLAAWIAMRRIPLPHGVSVWRRLLVQALLNSVVPFTLVAWAEQSVDAGLATILNSVSPVLVFVATLHSRHERPTARRLFGVVVGLGGVCLVVGTSALKGAGSQLLPQLAIVAAAFCYAGAALHGRAFDGIPPVVTATVSLLLGAALLLPASLLADRPWTIHPSPSSLAALLALATFSTAAAFVIYFRLVRTLGAVATTAQSYLRVPIGVALGVACLGESLPPTAWAGMVCVVAGVAAITIAHRRGGASM